MEAYPDIDAALSVMREAMVKCKQDGMSGKLQLTPAYKQGTITDVEIAPRKYVRIKDVISGETRPAGNPGPVKRS